MQGAELFADCEYAETVDLPGIGEVNGILDLLDTDLAGGEAYAGRAWVMIAHSDLGFSPADVEGLRVTLPGDRGPAIVTHARSLEQGLYSILFTGLGDD